jgi:hypothetical protein
MFYKQTRLIEALEALGYHGLNGGLNQWLRESTGLTGSTNDLWFVYLRRLGYTGSLNDMLAAYYAANPDTPFWESIRGLLFGAGEKGVWYDPSDFSTLYQDAKGTPPVTAVGQVVGLMLDKSRGLVLGSELVTNGGFVTDTGWVKGTGWSIADGVATHSGATVGTLTQSVVLTNLSTVKVTFTVTGYVSGNVYVTFTGGSGATASAAYAANGTYTAYLNTGTGNVNLYFASTVSLVGSIDNISVKELPGNHATQATTGSKPLAQATYASLDAFDDYLTAAAGGAGTTGILLCFGIRPSGTGTARTIWSDAAAHGGYRLQINASDQVVFSAGDGTPLSPPVANAPTTSTTGGSLAAATYYYVITATNALGESLKSNEVSVVTTGTTSSNTITWGAVAEATGYKIYRGTAAEGEDVFYTVGAVTTFLDTGAAATAGTPPTITDTAYTKLVGQQLTDGVDYVITAWHDGANLNVQVNSGTVATAAFVTATAGTAGFTIGRDNGAATSPFGSRIYSAVYRKNDASTAAERALVKAYIASKAGVTL